jgi:hypothetical protein
LQVWGRRCSPGNEPAVAGGVCLAEKVGELDGMSG